MAIEDVQEEWIWKERALTMEKMTADLHASQRPGPSVVRLDIDSDSGKAEIVGGMPWLLRV